MKHPTVKIRAIAGSAIAIILIYIAGKGYFENKDGWGWWMFGAVIALLIAFSDEDNNSETEEESQ